VRRELERHSGRRLRACTQHLSGFDWSSYHAQVAPIPRSSAVSMHMFDVDCGHANDTKSRTALTISGKAFSDPAPFWLC
jgi:hypothetical protein